MRPENASVLLIDAENVIGPSNPKVSLIRACVRTLLAAAGPVDHAVACFRESWHSDDTVASVFIELGVTPWIVYPGPDAAELALISHARYIATRGHRRRFLVASGDHRFAEVGEYGELHVLAWQRHPLAGRLRDAAVTVHRLERPTPCTSDLTVPAAIADHHARSAGAPRGQRAGHQGWLTPLTIAVLTGVGVGIGQRLLDAAANLLRLQTRPPTRATAAPGGDQVMS